jgi:hypothetical protein
MHTITHDIKRTVSSLSIVEWFRLVLFLRKFPVVAAIIEKSSDYTQRQTPTTCLAKHPVLRPVLLHLPLDLLLRRPNRLSSL